MIWTLITVAMLIVCIVVTFFDRWNELAVFGIMLFGIVSIAMISVIIANHCGTYTEVENTKAEYQSLVKRAELIDSNYEDVSKSEVIKDITNWNKQARSDKYWSENLWTSWFWNKKIVEEEKIIELD